MSRRTISRAFLSAAASAISRLSCSGVTVSIIPIGRWRRSGAVKVMSADIRRHCRRDQPLDRLAGGKPSANVMRGDVRRMEGDHARALGIEAEGLELGVIQPGAGPAEDDK